MEYSTSIEKNPKFLDVSSDLSNKSFLISPQNQKVLLMSTFEVQGIYEHISRKYRRDNLKNLVNVDAKLKQGRYIVRKIIGKGSFGSVVEAFDTATSSIVAVKIVRLKASMAINTSNEISNLLKVNSFGSENLHFVKLYDYFEQNGFVCIVLERLEKTLYQHLVEAKSMSLPEIASFAQQLFKALQILQKLNIVHCDLKPENIMIRDFNKMLVKIVDFGSSSEIGKIIYKFVQSRFYRSPEVALRLEYGLPIDMWSAGCILAELFIGKSLFESRSDTSQMLMTVSILGPLPRSMLEKSKYYKKYLNLTRIEINPVSLKNYIGRCKNLEFENSLVFDSFIDLIEKCLIYDPNERITPQEALSHPFVENKGGSMIDKAFPVPWPSLPYTTIFLSSKQALKPKMCTKFQRSSSNFQDTSPTLKNSTAVSKDSQRITSSDEELVQAERPGSYMQPKVHLIEQNKNITPNSYMYTL